MTGDEAVLGAFALADENGLTLDGLARLCAGTPRGRLARAVDACRRAGWLIPVRWERDRIRHRLTNAGRARLGSVE